MKYRLINSKTKEEHLCDKVIIDGFDYYVSDGDRIVGDCYIGKGFNGKNLFQWSSSQENQYPNQKGKVIATNNPNIDIPKVVDEAENLFWKIINSETPQSTDELLLQATKYGFKFGYNKSQETHPYSDEDMIEFGWWCLRQDITSRGEGKYVTNKGQIVTTKELLQIWKEQQSKIVYYET